VSDGWLTPGKLSLKDIDNYQASLFIELGWEEIIIHSNFEYYTMNPDCNYTWVPSSNGWAVANAVETISHPNIYYIGRSFEHGSVQVGKVFLYKGMFYAFNGSAHEATSYEVLVCERKIKKNSILYTITLRELNLTRY
jgi:hypothetical protein